MKNELAKANEAALALNLITNLKWTAFRIDDSKAGILSMTNVYQNIAGKLKDLQTKNAIRFETVDNQVIITGFNLEKLQAAAAAQEVESPLPVYRPRVVTSRNAILSKLQTVPGSKKSDGAGGFIEMVAPSEPHSQTEIGSGRSSVTTRAR